MVSYRIRNKDASVLVTVAPPVFPTGFWKFGREGRHITDKYSSCIRKIQSLWGAKAFRSARNSLISLWGTE